MVDILKRELIYISYYFSVQLEQIVGYWMLGIVLGSLVSVLAKDGIHQLFGSLRNKKWGFFGIVVASLLGIASPLCMYGTIPLAASFAAEGMRKDWLAAFMMSSVLLNPQLVVYSAALGAEVLAIRLVSCFLCGVTAGLLVGIFFREKPFFRFDGFTKPSSRDVHPNLFWRLVKNIGRNIKATGGYFLLGILLAALFQRYVPADKFAALFGDNRGFGVLMAATIGVPLYACGGGTIPLLRDWLQNGMSLGSAAAFMLTGPATKITNLGALKIVLGARCFIFYLGFIMLFALLTGLLIEIIR